MNEIAVVKELMGAKGFSGQTLAEKIKSEEVKQGKKVVASYVTNRLQSRTMTVEKLLELLDAMDCELIIRDKIGDKTSYVVDNENRNTVKKYSKKEVSDNE